MSSVRRVRLLVRGRVQGVFYRARARDAAVRLGVHGWVRNRPDGTVEAIAEGPEQALESFIAWCRQGPPAARVERVEVEPADEPVADGFEIRVPS